MATVNAVPKPGPKAPNPAWKHNCPECVFMTNIHGMDLYFCTFENLPVVTARFSDEPDGFVRDHINGDFCHMGLAYARKLARKMGLYRDNV